MASSVVNNNIPMDATNNIHEEKKKSLQKLEDLGLSDAICEKAKQLRWTRPTSIQKDVIPRVLEGKNLLVSAPSGVGKTSAYVLPILHAWLANRHSIFAVILTPTPESAEKIEQQVMDFGKSYNIKCAVIANGGDVCKQQILLARMPHFIIATPARLKTLVEITSGFSLDSMKFLVIDDVDKMSSANSNPDIFSFLGSIKRASTALAFSSEINPTIYSLREQLRIEIMLENKANDKPFKALKPYYAFPTFKLKCAYLLRVVKKLPKDRMIIFCTTCHSAINISKKLPLLQRLTLPFHEQMSQEERLSSLEKFKSHSDSILVCTDNASKGLDIPRVNTVISFDIPIFCEYYIDRIKTIARAGEAETSVTFITKNDVESYQRFQQIIGRQKLLFKFNSYIEIDNLMN